MGVLDYTILPTGIEIKTTPPPTNATSFASQYHITYYAAFFAHTDNAASSLVD